MAQNDGLNRRAFLKNAGLTAALVGATGAGTSLGTAAASAFEPAAAETNGRYDFDTPYSRVNTDCIKWDSPARIFGRENVQVGMGIADMDFKAAPCVNKAIMDRAKHENWGYLDTPKSYVDAIVAWNKKRYGLTIDPESVILTTGVHPGLIAALQTFAPPGTRVMLFTPTYNGFYGDLRYTHTIAEESLLNKDAEGRYSLNFDDIEKRMGNVNAVIMCNPQNPTGNVWTAEDLTRVGEIALKHHVPVLSDEIHCDFVTKGQKYTPFASLSNRDVVNNSLSFKAASKSFSLAAMKAAWFFSTNPDYVNRVKERVRADLTTLGMVVNRAVLTEGEDWLDQLLPYIDANHELVASYSKANWSPYIKTVKAQGTYLSWLDCTGLAQKINAKQQAEQESAKTGKHVAPEAILQRWFIYNAKVDLNPGNTYGAGGENHMRMNIATSRKTLQLALDNISNALKSKMTM